jgi:hypothetical protein
MTCLRICFDAFEKLRMILLELTHDYQSKYVKVVNWACCLSHSFGMKLLTSVLAFVGAVHPVLGFAAVLLADLLFSTNNQF